MYRAPSHLLTHTFRLVLHAPLDGLLPVLPLDRKGLPLRNRDPGVDPELEDSLPFVDGRDGLDRSGGRVPKSVQALSGKGLDIRSTSLAEVSRHWRPTQSFGIVISRKILLARNLHLVRFYSQICTEETACNLPTL